MTHKTYGTFKTKKTARDRVRFLKKLRGNAKIEKVRKGYKVIQTKKIDIKFKKMKRYPYKKRRE